MTAPRAPRGGGAPSPSRWRWALLVAAACGGARPTGGVLPTDAVITLRSNVGEAALWVDGRFVGVVGALRGGVALEPGAHRLELRHDDYLASYLELTVARGERRRLVVNLAPVLP